MKGKAMLRVVLAGAVIAGLSGVVMAGPGSGGAFGGAAAGYGNGSRRI